MQTNVCGKNKVYMSVLKIILSIAIAISFWSSPKESFKKNIPSTTLL